MIWAGEVRLNRCNPESLVTADPADPVLSEYSIAQIRDDDGTRRGLRRHGLRAGRRRGGDSRWRRWASEAEATLSMAEVGVVDDARDR